MLIKKFVGNSFDEIENQINNELGPNAVILMARTLESGFISRLFFKEEHEVTVGIDPSELEAYQQDKGIQNLRPKEELGAVGFEAEPSKVMRIPVTGPLKFDSEKKNILALVGPSGSGKSTIMTKLALDLQRTTPFKVAMVSLGTMPEDKLQRLQGLSKLFRVHHQIVTTPSQFQECLKQNFEIFILDTSGENDLVEIGTYVTQSPSYQILLVLSAADSIIEQMNASEKYKQLNPSGLIITKMDQNPDVMMLAQLALKQKIPFSYLSAGPDLTLANADDLEIKIINEKLRIKNL